MVYDTNAPLEASTTGLIHVSFKALSPQVFFFFGIVKVCCRFKANVVFFSARLSLNQFYVTVSNRTVKLIMSRFVLTSTRKLECKVVMAF